MEANQEGKAEKFFKDFGKKLDQFLVEAKDAGTRVESDLKKKYEEEEWERVYVEKYDYFVCKEHIIREIHEI